jgi:hypothetical protein
MSIYFELVNDRDKKTLTLGTGFWDTILRPPPWDRGENPYDRIPPASALEVLELLRASEAMRTWGDERLQDWSVIIADFMNGADTRLIHDCPDPEAPDDPSFAYDTAGYLKDMGRKKL